MNQKRSHHISWQTITLSVLCAVLFLILVALISGTAYVNHLLSLINTIPSDGDNLLSSEETQETWETSPDDTIPSDYTGPIIDPTDLTIDDTAPGIIVSGENIVNILLIGQDRRSNQSAARTNSDSMILCTFNKDKNTITLTSFMRDMYVAIPGWKSFKMNAAYPRGGVSLLKETLAVNFGVHVDVCLIVDFDAFTTVIDTLGGVDITLTAAEAQYLKTSYNGSWTLTEGLNTLTGEQALGYSRIRKIGDDYARTERQRNVIASLINKVKDSGWTTMLGMIEKVLPTVTSDTSGSDLIKYAAELFPLLKGDVITQRIPANGTFTTASIQGVGSVLIPDLSANRAILKNTLAG